MLFPITSASATAPVAIPVQPAHHRRVTVLVGLAAMLASPALAESKLEGRFKGRGEGRLDLQVFALGTEGPDDEHLVIAGTGIPNECTGEVRGVARTVSTGTLRLRRKTDEPEQICEITLRYSPDFTRVEMTAERCSDFHGTSCDFVGSLKRR